jgi:Sec-independent protein translocase protein TatA
MFGFSFADWIFIVVVIAIIFACVWISDMRKRHGKGHTNDV